MIREEWQSGLSRFCGHLIRLLRDSRSSCFSLGSSLLQPFLIPEQTLSAFEPEASIEPRQLPFSSVLERFDSRAILDWKSPATISCCRTTKSVVLGACLRGIIAVLRFRCCKKGAKPGDRRGTLRKRGRQKKKSRSRSLLVLQFKCRKLQRKCPVKHGQNSALPSA